MIYVQQLIIVENNVFFKVLYNLIIIPFSPIYLEMCGGKISHVWRFSHFEFCLIIQKIFRLFLKINLTPNRLIKLIEGTAGEPLLIDCTVLENIVKSEIYTTSKTVEDYAF